MAETQVTHYINTPVTPSIVDTNGDGPRTDTFLPDFDVEHQGQRHCQPNPKVDIQLLL